MTRAVFLDRDGVINRSIVRDGKPYPPMTLGEFELLPGVADAVRRLKDAGFLIVVATNQPDIATGKQRPEVVEAMHAHLRTLIPVDEIRMCPHTGGQGCDCRKPLPGMLTAAARDHGIDLAASYMVGDRWRDVDAGKAAGCFTFFIDYGYQEQPPRLPPDRVVASLAEAAAIILG